MELRKCADGWLALATVNQSVRIGTFGQSREEASKKCAEEIKAWEALLAAD